MAHYCGNSRDQQRAMRGAKTREDQAEGFNKIKKKMRAETEAQIDRLADKFLEADNVAETMFKTSVMGLQTNQEYVQKEKRFLVDGEETQIHVTRREVETFLKKTKKRRKKQAALSFDDEEDEDVVFFPLKRQKISRKNPSIDTSFLPDAQRDKQDEKLKENFREEWEQEQERIKNEPLEITYAYWDGSGHRRTTTVTKGTRINAYLEGCRKILAPHFSDLRGLHGSHLMFIKDELIIPHSYTFYDLIVTNARNRDGNLFKLEPYDGIDRDVGKPGKVITRTWYERNKHIYPASRWDTFDPSLHTTG